LALLKGFERELTKARWRYPGIPPRPAIQAAPSLAAATLKPESSRLSIEQIYLRYQEQVARWAQRLWGRAPGGDVEDIVQEVFLTVWREEARVVSLKRHDKGGDPLERWLYRVTEHAVYNHRWRERWRRRFTRSADSSLLLSQLPSDSPDALELLVQSQLRAQLKVDVYDVLDRLSDRYRTILILFELEELSGEAIAQLTGLKLATVWVRLHRARAKFMRELETLAPEAARTWKGNDA
jgi:RNA polymerase sigma-70 factor, ECF subfamily